MSTQVKRRRGTTAEHDSFTGAEAEATVDTDKNTFVIHDGATQGGFPLAKEDLSNVPATVALGLASLDVDNLGFDGHTISSDTDIILDAAGDVLINGDTIKVDKEMTTTDNVIVLNDGETGSGITAGEAGLQFDRGTETNYEILFQESNQLFSIGEVGNLQAVATRPDSPDDTGLTFWNDTETRIETSSDLTFDGSTLDGSNIDAEFGMMSSTNLNDNVSTFNAAGGINDVNQPTLHSGFYTDRGGAINSVSGGNVYMHLRRSDFENQTAQMALRTDGIDARVHVRSHRDGSWTDWFQVWHSGVAIDHPHTVNIQDTLTGVEVDLSSTLDVGGVLTAEDHILFEGDVTSDSFDVVGDVIDGFDVNQAGELRTASVEANAAVFKSFTAEVAQLFRGELSLTKSFGEIAEDFTIPVVGNTGSLTVYDVEGYSGFNLFEANDIIEIRLKDESGDGLTFGSVFGEVTNVSDNGDGTQSWDFETLHVQTSALEGMTAYKGSEARSYGSVASPVGVITDSVFSNVPHRKIYEWDTNPWEASNRDVIYQHGDLDELEDPDLSGIGVFTKKFIGTESLLIGDYTKSGDPYLEVDGTDMNAVGLNLDVTSLPRVSDEGLECYVPFENSAIDGSDHASLESGSSSFSRGIAGLGADFDGSSDGYQYTDLRQTDYMIFSIWFDAQKTATTRTIFQQLGDNGDRKLRIDNSDNLNWDTRSTSGSVVRTLTSDWSAGRNHIVFVQNVDDIRLYLNGELVDEDSTDGDAGFHPDFSLGYNRAVDNQHFDGQLDEFRAYRGYDIDMTEAELVKTLYLNPSGARGGLISTEALVADQGFLQELWAQQATVTGGSLTLEDGATLSALDSSDNQFFHVDPDTDQAVLGDLTGSYIEWNSGDLDLRPDSLVIDTGENGGGFTDANFFVSSEDRRLSLGSVFSADGANDEGVLASLNVDSNHVWTEDGSGTAKTFTGLQPYADDSTKVIFGGADDKDGSNARAYIRGDGYLFSPSISDSLISSAAMNANYTTNPSDADTFDPDLGNAWVVSAVEDTEGEDSESDAIVKRVRFRKKPGTTKLIFTFWAKQEISESGTGAGSSLSEVRFIGGVGSEDKTVEITSSDWLRHTIESDFAEADLFNEIDRIIEIEIYTETAVLDGTDYERETELFLNDNLIQLEQSV